MSKKQCQQRVWREKKYEFRQCKKTNTFPSSSGRWYCNYHHPDKAYYTLMKGLQDGQKEMARLTCGIKMLKKRVHKIQQITHELSTRKRERRARRRWDDNR